MFIFKKHSIRLWHKRISLVFFLPLIIIGITSVFMAHEKSLGLKNISIAKEIPSVHDYLTLENKTEILATKSGLFIIKNEKIKPVLELKNLEFKTLQIFNNYILATGKEGIYKGQIDKNWKQLLAAEVHSLQISKLKWRAITKNDGILESFDEGLTWKNDTHSNQSLTLLPAQEMHLGKLMHDLHTGKAIFGKKFEWFWIDSVAISLLFLSLSGLYIWFKSRRNKNDTKKRK